MNSIVNTKWRDDAILFIADMKDWLDRLPVYQERDLTDLIRRATLLLTPRCDEEGKP